MRKCRWKPIWAYLLLPPSQSVRFFFYTMIVSKMILHFGTEGVQFTKQSTVHGSNWYFSNLVYYWFGLSFLFCMQIIDHQDMTKFLLSVIYGIAHRLWLILNVGLPHLKLPLRVMSVTQKQIIVNIALFGLCSSVVVWVVQACMLISVIVILVDTIKYFYKCVHVHVVFWYFSNYVLLLNVVQWHIGHVGLSVQARVSSIILWWSIVWACK